MKTFLNHYVRTSARRKTVGVGIQIFNKQENQIKYDFTRITHIKSCNATSEPGMDDGHKKINQDSYMKQEPLYSRFLPLSSRCLVIQVLLI